MTRIIFNEDKTVTIIKINKDNKQKTNKGV